MSDHTSDEQRDRQAARERAESEQQREAAERRNLEPERERAEKRPGDGYERR